MRIDILDLSDVFSKLHAHRPDNLPGHDQIPTCVTAITVH